MVEGSFGVKKTPFGRSPALKDLFPSQARNQAKARRQFLADHHGADLLTGDVGSGKSIAPRAFTATLNPNLYKRFYLHWIPGSTLDLLRQLALELNLEPAHYGGDLVRQTSTWDASRYLTLSLEGQLLLRRTLSLQMHEPLRQRIAVQDDLEGLSGEEPDAYLAYQLNAAGLTRSMFDDPHGKPSTRPPKPSFARPTNCL